MMREPSPTSTPLRIERQMGLATALDSQRVTQYYQSDVSNVPVVLALGKSAFGISKRSEAMKGTSGAQWLSWAWP